ncbi:hypothetical protein ACN20G_28280 (plasmid) [Streptomyces sp. BI20]|uniref:hypothetical protein n=1 Tax=Streptomyces sp. BI20 TaxID=3403460 RepID=UPI003C71BFA8
MNPRRTVPLILAALLLGPAVVACTTAPDKAAPAPATPSASASREPVTAAREPRLSVVEQIRRAYRNGLANPDGQTPEAAGAKAAMAEARRIREHPDATEQERTEAMNVMWGLLDGKTP